MNSSNNQYNNVVIIVSLLALVLLGAFLVLRPNHGGNDTSVTATSTVSSTTVASTNTQGSSTGGVVGTGHYTVKILGTVPAAPDFKSSLVCASSINTSQCAQLQSQAAAMSAQLTKTPEDWSLWLGLGIARKTAGDYQGAISAWHYLTVLYPTDATAFSNLGDLYLNYLKDYSASVSNYKIAIKNNPTNLDAYKNIFQVYTTTTYTGGVGAAADILKQGIMSNPKAVDLQVILARYYKSQGDIVNAKATYNAAINNAQGQGETTLATQIQTEAAGL